MSLLSKAICRCIMTALSPEDSLRSPSSVGRKRGCCVRLSEVRITGIVTCRSRSMELLMSRRKKQKRNLPGHSCWVCSRRRPNEKFSGRGHALHICRDCRKLGSEELAYRQECRNLERCMTREGIIPRKRRKSFEQFLNHAARRIRTLAGQMQAQDQATRKLFLADREFEESASG